MNAMNATQLLMNPMVNEIKLFSLDPYVLSEQTLNKQRRKQLLEKIDL